MKPVPILIYTDNPSLSTGLARIGRHLAVVLSGMPEFRVGTFGRGGIISRKFPFAQYNFPESAEWGQSYLPIVWENFAGAERGVIFTIMDAARMHWFSQPHYIKNDGPLKSLLTSQRFERWGYFPVDHVCVNGSMSRVPMEAVLGYDRVLGYTIFGSEILSQVVGHEVDFIPHGINAEIFHPRGKRGIRWSHQIPDDLVVIGMVATNQVRKDWAMACQIIREMRDAGHKVKFLAIVDEPVRYWNLPILFRDYEIKDDVWMIDGSTLSDEDMANYYSMCDVTILPTLGEGFGYPCVESMFCGTPTVTVKYAGCAELVPQEWLVEPSDWQVQPPINAIRPVTNVVAWCDTIHRILVTRPGEEDCRKYVDYLDWDKLGEVWKKWFREGLADDGGLKPPREEKTVQGDLPFNEEGKK